MILLDEEQISAQPQPKLVPTLTESFGTPPAVPASPQAAPQDNPEDRIARALLTELGPELGKLIGETVARVVHEQMLGLSGRIRTEVTRTVHDAVARRLLAR